MDREAIAKVLDEVAADYGVTRYAMLGRSRSKNDGEARNEFWWRLFREHNVPREEIARIFKRPLRTIQQAIASRAEAHGETTMDTEAVIRRKELIRLLEAGVSYQDISEKLGYSVTSLPVLASRLKVRYAGIRATPERPAIPPNLTTKYRRLMQSEGLTPVEAAKRLRLMK